MVYSDGVHVVADSLGELHRFAAGVRIPGSWFHGVRKGHPHYDIPKGINIWVLGGGKIKRVRPREVLGISKVMR